MPNCVPIAHISEYDDDPFMVRLAAEAGRPNMVETCDVVRRHGESIYTDASIKALFLTDTSPHFLTDPGDLVGPEEVARNLRFYDAVPTLGEMAEKAASVADAPLPEQWVRRLEFFYSALSAAHTQFHVPYIFDEEIGELGKAQAHLNQLRRHPALVEQRQELALALIQWICGSPALPPEFFAVFARTVVHDALINEARGVPDARGGLQECLIAAFPIAARKRPLLDTLRSTHAVAIRPNQGRAPRAIGVGDILPSTALDTTIRTNRFTLLMAWAEWCGYCKQSFPQLAALQQELKRLGGGVVSFRHSPDNPAALRDAQQSGKIAWTDVELSDADFSKLNTRGNVPLVFLVNQRREVLYVSEGYNPKLTEEVLEALKAKQPKKLHR